MTNRLFVSSLACVLLLATQHSRASDTIERLKACARTDDNAARAACYETLGRGVLAAEASDDSAVESTRSADVSATLPDALGGTEYAQKAGEAAESNRGLVTSCEKAADKKWFYVFENGQVWKQVDSRRRRHKECHFHVTITKDGFGYKMLIDGTTDKIRINRRR